MEGAGAHVRAGGEQVDGERLVQVRGRPLQYRTEVVTRIGGHRAVDVLRLAAGAVRGNHHAPGQPVRDGRAEVAAHQVQAQVEGRGHARAGEHVAVVEVEHRVVDHEIGVAAGQQAGVFPVHRHPPPGQDARRRQREHPVAQRDQPGAPAVRGHQRVEQFRG
ncbi:Uncharacterised protein [Mycobacteroides abscessus subsp. abscessus]|nr:Uncharacterised protein [Mycobacteroides abscessus subsp. abscessus]